MRIKTLMIFLFIFYTEGLQAQQWTGRKVEKTFQKALEAYHQEDYSSAEHWLNKSLLLDSALAKIWLLKAEVGFEQHRHEAAANAYKKVLILDKNSYPQVYYSLGQLQFMQSDYQGAIKSLEAFLRFPSNSPLMVQKANHLLKNARFAQGAFLHPDTAHLKLMNSQINTAAEEYINFVNEDSNLLVFTRKFSINNTVQQKASFRELFFESTRKNNEAWQLPVQMSFPWAKGLNMGGLSMTVDKRQMYFTACYWPGGYGSCDVYQSKLVGTYWLPPHNLGKMINTSSWDSQASLSSDGHYLFYASKRPGGKGGSDIWMSERDRLGNWLPAINLGDSINTPGNEMAPFIHPDGQTLYFSSNGRIGMGGYDLYVSHKDARGHWSDAKNLGYPVNTHADELNIFIGLEGNQAWLSSNRAGTMDIYQFKTFGNMRPKPTLFVKGKVVDAKSGIALKAKVILTNISNRKVLDSLWADPVDGRFLMVFHPGEDVAFHILKKGYLFYSKHFYLKAFPKQKSLSADFRLVPIEKGSRMTLENILFDTDSSHLQSASYTELNLVVDMLRQNPNIHILITGYTDSTGSREHNLKLSVGRAKAVFNYLISKGIVPERMTYKGFGAQHPLKDNQSEQARAQNRRTEIIVQ